MAAAQYLDSIQQIYIAYFGRPADPAGLDYWAAEANAAGGDLTGILNSFSVSQESQSLYGQMTIEQTITAIYHYLFNRVPDGAGLTYWQEQITSGNVSSAAAAYAILKGAQFSDVTAAGNKLTVANAFTAQIDTAAEKAGYAGSASFAYARDFLGNVDATDSSLTTAQNGLSNAVIIATGTSTSPGEPPAAPALTITKDSSNIASLTHAGAEITVTDTGGTYTFTSSTGTTTLDAPIAGYIVPAGSTLIISSALAANTSFAGAGSSIIVASASGEDLTGLNASGETAIQLTSGQNYTLTQAEAAISKIGANGTPGELAHSTGTISVVDSLTNLIGNTGTFTGADSVTATLGSTSNIAAIDTSAITRLVLSSNQDYTMTSAQAGTIDTTQATTGVSITLTTAAAGQALAANVQDWTLADVSGNSVTLGSAAQNVDDGNATNNVTLSINGLTPTGTWALHGASDTLVAGNGANLSGLNSGNATTAENLTLTGTAPGISMTAAQYNGFSGTLNTQAGASVTITDSGNIAGSTAFQTYNLAAAGGSNITLTGNSAASVGGVGTGDTITVGTGTYTGAWSLGSSNEKLAATGTVDVTGVNGAAALHVQGLTLDGAITMTTAQYNGLTNGIAVASGGSAAGNTVTITNSGTLTDSASVDNYVLSTTSYNTFNIVNNAAIHVKDVSNNGGSTYNIKVANFTGNLELNASSAIDAVGVASGSDISDGTITGTAHRAKLIINGTGGAANITVNADEAAVFHASPLAFTVNNATSATMNIANTGTINLGSLESALTAVGVQAGSTVNISVGASTTGSGFNKTVIENDSAGNTLFTFNNGGAHVTTGTSDSTHYASINNFNTTSDNISLTLGSVAQTNGFQYISDSGNDTITIGNNGVILLEDLGAIPGFSVFDATDLSSATANLQKAVNAATGTTGVYTFVIDSNQGAAIYQAHLNSGSASIDGIQLVGVVHGVGTFNLAGHFG
ncbi:DUF4214 domain-containing protein [Pseudomonas sp. NPDC090202]|uniref:DUF4214 domain-containing protein n=1 Tax=unclassified Pseudomonas TaxID=196821 RepID=UPI003824529A